MRTGQSIEIGITEHTTSKLYGGKSLSEGYRAMISDNIMRKRGGRVNCKKNGSKIYIRKKGGKEGLKETI